MAAQRPALNRPLRVAAFLAIVYGVFGAFCGISGAATFVPYQVQDELSLGQAILLSGIAGFGAAISVVGIASGVGWLRQKSWAFGVSLLVSIGSIATVIVFALAMPATSPSPVPGGVGIVAFIPIVAVAYGAEMLLILVGRRDRALAAEHAAAA